jgi:hypothetical protein
MDIPETGVMRVLYNQRGAALWRYACRLTSNAIRAVLDPVIALWKERLPLTLRVEAFTRQQTAELAHTVLGGDVATELIDELQDRTAGNPLLLRGLLIPGRENGVLVHTDAGWQLRGTLRGDRQLYDLLEFRLRSFGPEELEAVRPQEAGSALLKRDATPQAEPVPQVTWR